MSTRVVRRKAGLAGWHVIAALIALIFVLPLVWTVAMSVKPRGRPFSQTLAWIPGDMTMSNYREVFEVVTFARFALNSVAVLVLAVPVTVAIASMSGFALAQLPGKWRLRLVAAGFIAMMVPFTAVWLPRFIFVKELGLIDSRWSLVLPSIFGTSPFYVFLFLWTFMRIPREVFDAGKVDGATPLRLWRDLAMPIARPTTVAVAVLASVRYWNNFVEPLLYISSAAKMTLPLGLNALLSLDRTDWPLLMTGAVLVTAPVVVLFLLAQRAFLIEPLHDPLSRRPS